MTFEEIDQLIIIFFLNEEILLYKSIHFLTSSETILRIPININLKNTINIILTLGPLNSIRKYF